MQTCGEFTFDEATSTVSGPETYMREQGSARLANLGSDPVFAINAQYAPDIITAILVTMQTDYAGWHGMQTFNAMRGAS